MNKGIANATFFIIGFIIGIIVYIFGIEEHIYLLALLSGVIFGIGVLLLARGIFTIDGKIFLKKPEYMDFIKIILGVAFVLSSLGLSGIVSLTIVYYYWFVTMFIVGFSFLIGSSYFARKLGRR